MTVDKFIQAGFQIGRITNLHKKVLGRLDLAVCIFGDHLIVGRNSKSLTRHQFATLLRLRLAMFGLNVTIKESERIVERYLSTHYGAASVDLSGTAPLFANQQRSRYFYAEGTNCWKLNNGGGNQFLYLADRAQCSLQYRPAA